MQNIIVASKNPVKLDAAREGFRELFPKREFQVEGISIPSGVSDQPMGNEETFQGALNRANGAREAVPAADFWVGIEGGNIRHEQEMETMAWIVVLDREGRMGKARTAGFFLPPKVVQLIDAGYELGHASDRVFGTDNSKQDMGAAGLLTDGAVDRLRFYVPAVILALIPFLKKRLYEGGSL